MSNVTDLTLLGDALTSSATGIKLDDANSLSLSAYNTTISDTAVDVFIYDTSKDSDAGAWRQRTQHTSWYNETLNTATRGSRREFPAVAVIVAEATQLTIYDGDEPDCPMWMVFNGLSIGYMIYGLIDGATSVVMQNAQLVVSTKDASTGGVNIVDFIKETGSYINESPAGPYKHRGNIKQRNDALNVGVDQSFYGSIVDRLVNDVAMTVLPSAPIDSATGLPVPTIAVATDGGTSIIKDDGTVVDLVGGSYGHGLIKFLGGEKIYIGARNVGTSGACLYGVFVESIPAGDIVLNTGNVNNVIITSGPAGGYVYTDVYNYYPFNRYSDGDGSSNDIVQTEYGTAVSTTAGVAKIISEGILTDITNSGLSSALITSDYNTGWMPGDIKLATLADTTAETVGIVETTDVVTNGIFDTDSDWTKTTGWTIGGGTANHAGAQGYLQQVCLVVGKRYKLTFTCTGQIVLPNTVGLQTANRTFNDGTFTVYGTAVSDTLSFYSNGTSTVDNVIVTETAELVDNGNFQNDVYGWVAQAGAGISRDNTYALSGTHSLKVDISGDAQGAYSTFAAVAGKKYTISFGVYMESSTTVSTAQLEIGNVVDGNEIFDVGFANVNNVWQNLSYTITALNTETLYVFFRERGSANNVPFWLDDVSLRLAEPDRSVNGHGLQVFGEVTKTAVATGADLVAYSGFSTNNYLQQRDNVINYGSAATICLITWQKITDISSYSYATSLYDTTNAALIGLSINQTAAGNEGCPYLFDNTNSGLQSGVRIDDGQWHQVVGVLDGTTKSIYVDGVLRGTETVTAVDFSSVDRVNVGHYTATGEDRAYHHLGSLALIRHTQTAPTAEQIAKMYNDEKFLFQDNAQATLYGTSDAVTALAYDEKTELLHVGTSQGRSVFKGLNRVDNTTDAVATTISARNQMIAEQ